ncbi:MAG: DUF4442 domain-containing protein [Chitinophagaceae bacterium]
MNPLVEYFEKAKNSSFRRWILNRILWRMVPFNNPHKIKIVEINDAYILFEAPYRRSNRNHIKGIHACLLATLCEYTVGVNLMINLSPTEYRIIMKQITMVYHYQAKTAVRTKWGISREMLENEILQPLKREGVLFKDFVVEVYDLNDNHICTGTVQWQLKEWKNVKTKLN